GDVLLTGATGFLGMELLARFLARTDRTVLAIVRARDSDHARARIDGVLELMFGAGHIPDRGRGVAIPGDLERPGLGLAPEHLGLIRERAAEIVHGAASVSFARGLPECRRTNVEGTANILSLAIECARHGELRHFAHISTAYVAGKHKGEFAEDQL